MKTLGRPADREALVARLRRLPPTASARWGRMSVHQMVCHVGDAFRMALGETPATGPATLAQRTVIKWIALYAPLRWPAGIDTSPELDQCAGAGTRPAAFAADLARAEALLLAVAEGGRWAPRHPVFGRISAREWLRWGYLHTDHHLRQFGA
jgi:hypothetical protein